MKERREILAAFARVCARGEAAVLASVVGTEGSTYRRPGARLLIPTAGDPIGLISGGCLESDVAQRAAEVAASGSPRLVVYDSRDDEDQLFGLGLGCRGVVRLLLERVSGQQPGPLAYEAACVEARRVGAMATVVAGAELGRRWLAPCEAGAPPARAPEAVARALERTREDGAQRVLRRDGSPPGHDEAILIEPVLPDVQLLVLGAGTDAEPIVAIARELGWDVRVWDVRPAFAKPERFPGAQVVCCDLPHVAEAFTVDRFTAAVAMTHHFERDRTLLGWLLSGTTPYVAALGPRARSEELLAELAQQGVEVASARLRALHAPAGLDLGAESAAAIALSIVAEVQAHFAGRAGGSLRERDAPIHASGRAAS